MVDTTSPNLYLLKAEDSEVFGPVDFKQVTAWATAAQISPLDKVSSDQQTWFKAPMVPELEMDWLIELTSEQLYGPTTLGAIQEFLNLGEVISTRSHQREGWFQRQVQDIQGITDADRGTRRRAVRRPCPYGHSRQFAAAHPRAGAHAFRGTSHAR